MRNVACDSAATVISLKKVVRSLLNTSTGADSDEDDVEGAGAGCAGEGRAGRAVGLCRMRAITGDVCRRRTAGRNTADIIANGEGEEERKGVGERGGERERH